MKNIRVFCFVLLPLILAAGAWAQGPQSAELAKDHDALRALLVRGAEALNKRNFDAVAPSLHPAFTIITADNQKHVGLDAFKKYYLGLFEGPNAVLSKFETRVTADDETRFIDAGTGVVYGTSQETYQFKDGDVRTMQTRWSAVTKKEAGDWKLVNVHFSANVLDNPVLDATKSVSKKLAAGGAVIGLVVGVLLMALLRRRART
jgi:ketosteroid isomerase-like protein